MPNTQTLTNATAAEIDALWLGHLQAIAKLEQQIRFCNHTIEYKYSSDADKAKAVQQIEEYIRQIGGIRSLLNPLQRVFDRRGGWSRFYVVTNVNGHIHSSRECGTCFPTTQYAWITALSGSTEQELVAQYGEAACTICFPSAPTFQGFGDGTSQLARYTQAEKDARAAEKAAKASAKALKQLNERVTVDGGRYETIPSAKQGIRDAVTYSHYYGNDNAARYTHVIEVLSAALLATGRVTQDEIDSLKAKALKRAQKEVN
jgi:hypothetical protein